MSHRRAKRIRKALRQDGIAIEAIKYQRQPDGSIMAEYGRRTYQSIKRSKRPDA